jgi:hypothetical protein
MPNIQAPSDSITVNLKPTSKLLEEVMRRSFQKVPINWLCGDGCVSAEPTLIFLNPHHQEKGGEPMPFINIKVLKGTLSAEKKKK